MVIAEDSVRGSAAWAGYGDALGFITELTDADGVRRRSGKDRVTTTVGWKRRIGGQFGVTAELPPGAYSDDTQLRLATARAIRGDGEFDVAAFAKVELPSWLAYALGGGRGSKAAAAGMSRVETKWTTNMFSSGQVSYIDVGGNGAAMRVQPHVWGCRDLSDSAAYTRDVIRNAVVSHGHPRGIYGAVLHARALAYTLVNKTAPDPSAWADLARSLTDVHDIIEDDADLSNFWLPAWERAARGSFRLAAHSTVTEIRDLVVSWAGSVGSTHLSREDLYAQLLADVGGLDPAVRGSATITAVAAMLLAHLWGADAEQALVTAVNVIGSDTDTIATMAGALMGAVVARGVPGQLQDADVIDKQARRLWAISVGKQQESFRYPDPLKYAPPRTPVDLVGRIDGGLGLSGLGRLSEPGPELVAAGKTPSVYQWVLAATGQQMFIRRRQEPKPLPASSLAGARLQPRGGQGDQKTQSRRSRQSAKPAPNEQPGLFDPALKDSNYPRRSSDDLVAAFDASDLSVDEAVFTALKSELAPDVVGRLLLLRFEVAGSTSSALLLSLVCSHRACGIESPSPNHPPSKR